MPVRIILIGAVVFLAAWFTVLKPKPESVDVPNINSAVTPQSGLGKAVDKAKVAAGKAVDKAVATSTPAAATSAATTTVAPAPTPSAPPVAIPAEALAKLPSDVAGALQDRKILVLGVFADDPRPWRPLADDDRYVRNALRKTNRYDGEVFVKHVGISKLSTYGSLVNDLHVTQSPSVVLIGPDLKGTVLTGYADRASLNQAISDVRRTSVSPVITDTYLRTANKICGRYETRYTRWSRPTIRGAKAQKAAQKRLAAIIRQYRREIARTPAPTKWKGLKTKWVKVMTSREKAATTGKLSLIDSKAARSLDQAFDAAGLTDCTFIRRS
jgi:hypothetical protein